MKVERCHAGDDLQLVEVEQGIFAVIGHDGAANSGFVVGDDAVALIDAQASPRLGAAVSELVTRVTQLPVRYAIITHYHGDHLFGLQAWPDILALAHPDCARQLQMLTARQADSIVGLTPPGTVPLTGGDLLKIFVGLPAATQIERTSEHPIRRKLASSEFQNVRLTIPADAPLDGSGSAELDLGSATLKIVYPGPGHTDADLLVEIADRDVCFLGDLGFVGRIPAVTSPYLDAWIRLTERLAAGGGTVVPGHGPVATPKMLADQLEYLEALKAALPGGRDNRSGFAAFAAVPAFDRWHDINLAVMTKFAEGGDV